MQKQINEIIDDCNKAIALLDVLDWEIPSLIYLYLRTHGELSLKQLANSIGKSKTTIKRHLDPMLNSDLIKERIFKKAYYYQLDEGLLRLNTPFAKFVGSDSSRKEIFENLLENMTHDQLEIVNKASFSIFKIGLKILQNNLDATLNYVDVFASMTPDVNRIIDTNKLINVTLIFTALNDDNKPIFNKHWDIFLENYNKEISSHIADPKKKRIPNFEPIATTDLAWQIIIPTKQMFKLK